MSISKIANQILQKGWKEDEGKLFLADNVMAVPRITWTYASTQRV
jgi:hypothetical protein